MRIAIGVNWRSIATSAHRRPALLSVCGGGEVEGVGRAHKDGEIKFRLAAASVELARFDLSPLRDASTSRHHRICHDCQSPTVRALAPSLDLDVVNLTLVEERIDTHRQDSLHRSVTMSDPAPKKRGLKLYEDLLTPEQRAERDAAEAKAAAEEERKKKKDGRVTWSVPLRRRICSLAS